MLENVVELQIIFSDIAILCTTDDATLYRIFLVLSYEWTEYSHDTQSKYFEVGQEYKINKLFKYKKKLLLVDMYKANNENKTFLAIL